MKSFKEEKPLRWVCRALRGESPTLLALALEEISAGPPPPSSHVTLQVFAVERLNFITHLFSGTRGLQYCPAFQKWPRPRLLSLEPLKLGCLPAAGCVPLSVQFEFLSFVSQL